MSQEAAKQLQCLLSQFPCKPHSPTLLIYSLHVLWFCGERIGTVVHFQEFHDKKRFRTPKRLICTMDNGHVDDNALCILALRVGLLC